MNYRTPPPQPPDVAKHAARAAGQMKYIGNCCKHGHDGIRYTSTGHCVDCHGNRDRKKGKKT